MNKLPVAIAAVCFVLAVVIFVFAEGARAVYSGLFFLVLAASAIWSAKRKAKRNVS